MKQNLLLHISFEEESDTEPVTVAEVKNWLKIDVTDDDTLIESLITAARQQCENYLSVSLIERTVSARLLNELGDFDLPYRPIVLDEEGNSFLSITNDDDEPEAIENYTLRFNRLSTENNCIVNVSYLAGYPDGLPKVFKTAILNQVAWLYENRGSELPQEIGNTTILILKPYRKVS